MKLISLTAVAILTLFTLPPSHAKDLISEPELPAPYSQSLSLLGYEPSLISSEPSAKLIYNRMPTEVFSRHSGCYQRAHYWTHELFDQFGLKSMKVFLFFTDRYRREFNYQWSFHVAPLIPVKKDDGTIEEMVFDPVFVSPPSWARPGDLKRYDARPISIEAWTRYFIFPESACPLIESYADYLNHQELNYCFIMKTPMFTYSPLDFERDETGKSGSRGSDWYDPKLHVRTNWRPGDLENMVKGLKTRD